MRCIALVTVIFLTLLADLPHVRADWYFKFVRITCVPDADYASIETLGIYNVTTAAQPVPPALAAAGFYELWALAKRPVGCKLHNGVLEIGAVNYHPPMASGECGANEDADLELSWNGKQVAIIRGTHGGCRESQRHLIEYADGVIQHCTLNFPSALPSVNSTDFVEVPAKCQVIPIS